MGQLLHGSARTTAAVRRAIQRSQESLQTLATRHGINPNTVAKWRQRATVQDAPMGPAPASTVLTAEQEAIAVAFRRHTLLPLDDCLYALQATILQLSRSALHRCFQRHGISRLPLNEDGQSPPKKKFKDYPIGYRHVDFAEVQAEEGKQYLFVAIDRTSKVAFAELHPRAKRVVAAEFLRRVLDKRPYQVHTVLTDNGVQFTPQAHQFLPGGHSFGRICWEYGVEHRLTKPAHPWTNGQVERMNRTIKEATVQRYHYQTTDELNEHLQAFLLAYNHAKRLKTLRGLTPHEFVCAQWQKPPAIFKTRPTSRWDYTPNWPKLEGTLRAIRTKYPELLAKARKNMLYLMTESGLFSQRMVEAARPELLSFSLLHPFSNQLAFQFVFQLDPDLWIDRDGLWKVSFIEEHITGVERVSFA